MELRPADDLAAFQRDPTGTWLSDQHFLYLCQTEELYAFFIWGQPQGDETRRLVQALAAELRPEAKPHRTYVDFSGMTGIDRESFGPGIPSTTMVMIRPSARPPAVSVASSTAERPPANQVRKRASSARDADHQLAARVAFAHVLQRRGDLAELVLPLDDRPALARLDELLQGDEVLALG